MRCAKCDTDNRDTAKFCDKCGARLSPKCPSCGAENRPDARFCDSCGAALGPGPREAIPEKSAAGPQIRIADTPSENVEGERKTVTALFADIKGSMELMEELDPEEARAIVDPALKLMIDAVHRYAGYIVQSTGDGIFALFGAPVAHEDHPQRALYAALRMQEDFRRYSAKLREAGNLPIEARVGVNTGEVVVRSISTAEGRVEYTPIGHSTGLAARMQTLAPTGSIAVTQQTQKLCEGYFTFKSLGPTSVKGVSEPVQVFEVTGLGPLRSRFQSAVSRGLTKFVGRQREMDVLRHALEEAKAAHGQIVAAIGEPGVGKSRLFFEFKAGSQSGWMVLESLSVSYGKASAFLPVVDLLHSYFEIKREDDTRKRQEKVAGRITILDRALEETLPYFFGLLGLVDGDDPLAGMDAQIRRRRTLDAIKRIILRESLNQPVLLMFEDLHWIDEETQALLNLLVDSIATSRILVLVNYRPEYSHGWGNKTYYTQLRLDPIGRDNAEEMLTALLGSDPTVAPLKRLIIRKTEGNPFFMEETVQALFEDGALIRNGGVKLAKPLERLQIPATVQRLLASRIDRLPHLSKDLLQTLAVIGKEFPLSLAHEVWREPQAHDRADALEQVLSELQSAEFIYEQPTSGDIEYTFKHALTQEVAYHSILTERRKKIHERVGIAIEVLYQGRLEEHLAELAHHYQRSSDADKAIAYLKRSADQAAQRSSVVEAEAQYRDAISIVRALPPTRERDSLELGVHSGLAAVLIGKGWGVSAREESLIRAMELCDRVGDRRESLGLLFQLGQFYLERLRLGEARQLAERGIALAQSVGDQIQEAGAWEGLAESFFWGGDLITAKGRLERASELLAKVPPDVLVSSFGFDLWVTISGQIGAVELIVGRPDRSVEWENLIVERVTSSPHIFSKVFAMFCVSWIATLRRDLKKARDHLRVARDIGEEHGFTEVVNFAMGIEGYIRFWQGEREVGLAQLKLAIEELVALGSRNGSSWRMACLAEMQLQLGELAAAECSLEGAFEIVKETGEGWAEPEVHRVAAEASLRKPGGDMLAAERRFEEAIAIARKQSGKWWELRATIGLVRLLRDTGRRGEARAMLAEIYNWFTEGLDTADLKDAKALLDELNG